MTDTTPEPADGGEEIYEDTNSNPEFVQPDADSAEDLGDKIDGKVDDLAENNEADPAEGGGEEVEVDHDPEADRPDEFEAPSTESIEGTKLAKDSSDLMHGRLPDDSA